MVRSPPSLPKDSRRLCAAATRSRVARPLPAKPRCLLGSVGLLDPRSSHSPRHFTSRAIHFKFGLGTALGWREWVDNELSDVGFMGLLQRVGVLKAIVSSRCLSNFRDLYNLRHLVRWWCTTTHTFFFSCGELTVTLEDMANQLLLPILSNADPATLEFSLEEEAIETELKKRMAGNA